MSRNRCYAIRTVRFIILEAVVQDTPFLFVNIYTPNKIHEQEAFFQNIERNLDSYDFDPNSKVVIGGDFNFFFLTKIWIVWMVTQRLNRKVLILLKISC